MNRGCTDQPLSWLKLEQYLLGELSAEARVAVDGHLAGCPGCRALLEQIRQDCTPLPALSALACSTRARPAPAAPERAQLPPPGGRLLPWPGRPAVTAARRSWRSGRYGLLAASLAAAATLLLVLLPDPVVEAPETRYPAARIGIKGGELALTLVRERAGQVTEHATRFQEGDRWRVLVTCPPRNRPLYWELVVFQGDELCFPWDSGQLAQCGNQVPLPGALRLSGEQTTHVCLVTGEEPVARALLQGPSGPLPTTTVCATLRPVHAR